MNTYLVQIDCREVFIVDFSLCKIYASSKKEAGKKALRLSKIPVYSDMKIYDINKTPVRIRDFENLKEGVFKSVYYDSKPY